MEVFAALPHNSYNEESWFRMRRSSRFRSFLIPCHSALSFQQMICYSSTKQYHSALSFLSHNCRKIWFSTNDMLSMKEIRNLLYGSNRALSFKKFTLQVQKNGQKEVNSLICSSSQRRVMYLILKSALQKNHFNNLNYAGFYTCRLTTSIIW